MTIANYVTDYQNSLLDLPSDGDYISGVDAPIIAIYPAQEAQAVTPASTNSEQKDYPYQTTGTTATIDAKTGVVDMGFTLGVETVDILRWIPWILIAVILYFAMRRQ